MAHQIVWSKRASKQLYAATAYLAENWPTSVVTNFVDDIFKATEMLSKNPEIGQKSAKNSDLRSCLVRPYTRLLYRIKLQKVIITSMYDTRQQR